MRIAREMSTRRSTFPAQKLAVTISVILLVRRWLDGCMADLMTTAELLALPENGMDR
jgi:hypothetical protein